MQSDGISYLDMGDALVRGDWSMGINAHWSPLYPLLLGLALKSVRPSPYSQFTLVHVVNFLIYLFTLFSFHDLVNTLISSVRQRLANQYFERLRALGDKKGPGWVRSRCAQQNSLFFFSRGHPNLKEVSRLHCLLFSKFIHLFFERFV
jgi:hypothetical protein